MSGGKERPDALHDAAEHFHRHVGMQRQRQDFTGDPLSHRQIAPAPILQQRKMVAGLPMNARLDVARSS
jgi:hypothetical protein